MRASLKNLGARAARHVHTYTFGSNPNLINRLRGSKEPGISLIAAIYAE
jgi:hypothetical protein